MEVFQAMKEHMKFALQNDQMAFHQIADIYTTESVSEIRATLSKYYEDKQQQMQAQQEQVSQIEQQKIAAQQQMHAEDMQLKQYIADTTNETKIQVAQIATYNRQMDLDVNENLIPDPLEIGAQALKQRELDSKNFIENLKLQADKVTKAKELNIKEKEIQSKEKIEKMKADTALKVAKTNKNKYDK